MRLKLKYFGAVAEAIGKQVEVLNFEGDRLTLEDVRQQCHEKYPALKKIAFQVAVNKKITGAGVIESSDELALLPPFSGG